VLDSAETRGAAIWCGTAPAYGWDFA
jgi:hypothetical protein